MDIHLFSLLIIAVPFLGAFFLFILREKVCELFISLFFTCAIIFSILILHTISRENIYGHFIVGKSSVFSLLFLVDNLGAMLTLLFAFLFLIVFFYALPYIDRKTFREYYFTLAFIFGGLAGAVYSDNLLLYYIFYEIIIYSLWRMRNISHFEEPTNFVIQFSGSALLLTGIILIYRYTGTLNILELQEMTITGLIYSIIFIGLIIKSGLISFYFAQLRVSFSRDIGFSTIESCVLPIVPIILFIRLAKSANPTLTWILIFSICIMWLGAIRTYLAHNFDDILAYSVLAHVGVILLTANILSKISTSSTLLYTFVFVIGQTGLTFGLDTLKKYGTNKLVEIGISLNLFALAGFPPFGGFFAKYFTILVAVSKNYNLIAFFVAISMVILALAYTRLFYKLFIKRSLSFKKTQSHYNSSFVIFLGIISLLLGIFAKFLWLEGG